MVNGKSLSAARPPDVRKGSAFPVTLLIDPGGCASESEAEPQRTDLSRFGKPKVFRTSGGGAEDRCSHSLRHFDAQSRQGRRQLPAREISNRDQHGALHFVLFSDDSMTVIEEVEGAR